MRRLLGPVGGPFLFFLVAALVFAGLGWVTVVALRVEQAQREAAAQAAHGANLRVAVRQLDTRVLSTLVIEDSRPFYHYNSADPLSGSTAGPTPLLAAPLPDWMKLHVLLDPTSGWDSPQVLTPEAADRVNLAWPDLPLRNNTVSRAEVLKSIQQNHPVVGTWSLLGARDQAIVDNSLPFAVPLFTLDQVPPPGEPVSSAPPDSAPKPPPPPGMGPATGLAPAESTSDAFRIFGWSWPRREAVADNTNTQSNLKKEANPPAPRTSPPVTQVPANPAPGSGSNMVGGRAPSQMPDGDRGRADYNTRAQTIQRGIQEAKNAALDFPYGGKGFPQSQFPGGPPSPGGDSKGVGTIGNQLTGGQPVPAGGQPGASTTPAMPGPGGPLPPITPVVPGGFSPQPVPGVGGGIGTPGDKGDKTQKDGKDKGRAPGGKLGEQPSDPNLEKLLKEQEAAKTADTLRYLRSEQHRGTFTEHLATLGLGVERYRCLDDLKQAFDESKKQDAASELDASSPLVAVASAVADAASQFSTPPGRPVPPAEERPPPTLPATTPLAATPVNIHLGSMRPQWITAADGTQTLVLVRAVRIDNKTVYQGVILDWAKLQHVLKEEVKDLFPDAKLLPVTDPEGVSPDRAMTALPVELDPGTSPTPPPAGWTPLRFGLVLAWVAALVAFAAVGFSGWSLIDLAERRIRFVSAVTHELRTPLTSLRIYLDLLMSGMIHDEAKRQEYLNTLATESDRLHRLIDNVLDFAKLEKRAKNGDMKPVKIGELIEQLKQTWTDRVAADGKELVVISTLPDELEVCTDPVMVHQIVGNLIDNARKYTRDAEDKRIWLWAKPGGSGRVVFEVEDRGAGVPASERKSIFKPFRRGEHADAKAGGAGLGLALAKQWAEVLGGTVAYRPADGAPGACFRLELPKA